MPTAHRCHPPRRALRGAVYTCWCGRRWTAFDTVTIRDGKVCALRPDWRVVADAPEAWSAETRVDRAGTRRRGPT